MSHPNDDYWNSSSASKFSFEEEDLSFSQIDSVANDVFCSKHEESDIFSIDFIISKKCLELLLGDVQPYNIYVVPPVKEVIRKMILGQRFILDVYKSYKDKISLLDEALKCFHGDIILKVTYFLRRTLKFNIFCNILIKRRTALHQYSNYLKCHGNVEELENLYMATGFTTNIRDVYYLNRRKGAIKQDTLQRLSSFISSHSQYLTILNERKFYMEYIKFLEWQIVRKESSESIVEQLAFICNNQWEQNANDSYIQEFKNAFKIDTAQYEWTVVNCLSFLGLWRKLIAMFVQPNWFTKKNVLKTSLNPEYFIWGVSRHNPPKNVLEQLMICLSDSETSLMLAEKLHCYKFMIEYYIHQRDRLGLLTCVGRVMQNSEEYFLIKKALESQDKKWKN